MVFIVFLVSAPSLRTFDNDTTVSFVKVIRVIPYSAVQLFAYEAYKVCTLIAWVISFFLTAIALGSRHHSLGSL